MLEIIQKFFQNFIIRHSPRLSTILKVDQISLNYNCTRFNKRSLTQIVSSVSKETMEPLCQLFSSSRFQQNVSRATIVRYRSWKQPPWWINVFSGQPIKKCFLLYQNERKKKRNEFSRFDYVACIRFLFRTPLCHCFHPCCFRFFFISFRSNCSFELVVGNNSHFERLTVSVSNEKLTRLFFRNFSFTFDVSCSVYHSLYLLFLLSRRIFTKFPCWFTVNLNSSNLAPPSLDI